MSVPDVEGVITAAEVSATADAIAALQLPNGMIPWYQRGHCDPWNHVETAMALDVAGRHDRAAAAYRWLADIQRRDGSWHNYYLADRIEDAKLDTNVCAYIATGAWHHWLVTGAEADAARLWPVVEKAIDWVLHLQTPSGEVIWAREVDRRPWSYALLTGSSSIAHSLECAVALAELLGEHRPDWELCLVNLTEVIRTRPDAFADKQRWAMDWYYPVLTGVLRGDAARLRLSAGWETFVMPGKGVRCVSDEPWVTAAETAECALAHLAVGESDIATDLLRWTRAHREPDGAYLTGLVHPEGVSFPVGERTAYTGAAVIIAADALSGATPASGLFLPAPALADEPGD
jgi:MMP endo-(1,4)-3-O-methyl-alpha-D-mannosidase